MNRKITEHDNHCTLCEKNEPELLNKDVHIQEIAKIVRTLPNGKSAGPDGIVYEMFKCGLHRLGSPLVSVFNMVLKGHVFPDQWTKGMLTLLHKGGKTDDLNNYRGISLLSCMGKLFSKVLNNRLVQHADINGLNMEEQAAYRKGYGTVDQIFVLQSLIQKQLSQKNGRYYVLFVDFHKAFDGIPHAHLIYTLIKNGIHGHMLHTLRSLYDNLKSCIRMENGRTEYFECTTGTRQGCILSPFLFSLYISKLVDMLKSYNCQGIYVNDEAQNIMILLYADDVAKGGTMVKKLQDMIDVLQLFSDQWGLKVNQTKTKVMVFRKGGVLRKSEKWFLYGKPIEIVTVYKYLGLLFTPGLTWSKTVNTIAMQAKKAVVKLIIYSIKCGGFPTKVAFELFDKMVLPMLTYGAEIWGTKQHKVVEGVQIYFCKKTLGLPIQTSNSATVGECGRFPIYVQCIKKCVKYWLKLLQMPSYRYPKCCYLMLKRMDERGKHTWATDIKTVLYKFGFGAAWMNQGVGDERLFVAQLVQVIKDCSQQEWYSEIHQQSKLSTYCTFKSMLEPEKYLDYVNIWRCRKALAKFRCSAHSLAIEKGRHEGTRMEHRICTHCENERNVTVIEDEYHFLLCCPKYEDLRRQYIPMYVNVNFENFISLMSSQHCETLRNLSLFIYHAFK